MDNDCDIITEMDNELYNEHKWTQGEWRNAVGARCLLGTLNWVCEGTAYSNAYSEGRDGHEVAKALASIIEEDYPDRKFPSEFALASDHCINFNDHGETTFEDVKKVIAKAKEKLCVLGASADNE